VTFYYKEMLDLANKRITTTSRPTSQIPSPQYVFLSLSLSLLAFRRILPHPSVRFFYCANVCLDLIIFLCVSWFEFKYLYITLMIGIKNW